MLETILDSSCGKKAVMADPELQKALNVLRREMGPTRHPDAKEPRNFVEKLWGTRKQVADIAFEHYVNFLLSSPATHQVNILSNTLPIGTRLIESAFEATAAKIWKSADEAATYKEIVAEAQGMAEGFVDAFKFVWRSTKSGMSKNEEILDQLKLPSDLSTQSKVEYGGRHTRSNPDWDSEILKRGVDAYGRLISAPGTALSTMDTFFKVINYRAETSKRIFRQAASKFNDRVSINTEVKRLRDAMDVGLTPEIVAKGLADADFRTYTNRPVGAWNRAMAEKGHTLPGMRWIAPFRRTMVNILNYPISTPTGFIGKALVSKNPAERNDAIGRLSVSMMGLVAIYSVASEALDGAPPRDAQMRDLWEKNGHKANTVNIGGKQIKMDAFGQYGPLLKAAARYQQLSSEIDYEADQDAQRTLDSMASDLLFAVAETTFSEHWMENVAGLIDALSSSMHMESTDPLKYFAARMATGVIPKAVDAANRAFVDPEVKDVDSVMNAFLAKVPGYSQKISPKIDLWGDPITYDHFIDPDMASPITGKDPVSQELERLRFKVPKARRSTGKGPFAVKMTSDEYTQFMIYSGKGSMGLPPLRDALIMKMSSPLYKKFPGDYGRNEYLKRTVNLYRKAARTALSQDPRFTYGQRIIEMKQEIANRMRATQ